MSEQTTAAFVCTAATFCPCQPRPVRWLDVEQDYELARGYWADSAGLALDRDEWRGFWQNGYRYAAIVEDGRIVALAAALPYSEEAWETAAVSTAEAFRRKGYGKSVVSFVTGHIVASGRAATCHTRASNVAMQRTAQSVGFCRVPDGSR